MKKYLFKVILICAILLLFLIGYVEQVNAANNGYKPLIGANEFSEIKEQVVHSAKGLSQHKAGDAYREIVKALNDFHKLREIVKRSSHIDDVIEEVADGLDGIAFTYEKVAGLDKELKTYRKKEFNHLEDMSGETLKNRQELELEISGLQDQNKLLKEKMLSAIDDIEEKNIEFSLKSNESVIASLRSQTIIWNKFYVKQDQLFSKFNLNGRKIDLLLHFLEVNARVYREAANVARLRKTAKGALDNLSSLSDIEDIIGDLQNSWTEVDNLVSDISEAEFIVDID